MALADVVEALAARVDALEAKFAASPAPAPGVGSILIFNRPNPTATPIGVGSRMDVPDVLEAVRRACFGVDYQGNVRLAGDTLEWAWAEVERLKVADPKLLPLYEALDPSFAGFALLTGLIEPSKYDALGFGVNAIKRESFAGQTIASWLEGQLAITSGGPGIAGE